jgi:hypothetical protein
MLRARRTMLKVVWHHVMSKESNTKFTIKISHFNDSCKKKKYITHDNSWPQNKDLA